MKRIHLLCLTSFALLSCASSQSSQIESHSHEFEKLVILQEANRHTYLEGSSFDPEGLEVGARCKGCKEVIKTDFRIKDGELLPLEQESVTIEAKGLTLDYPIKVKESFHIACVGDSLTKGHMWQNQSYPTYLSSIVEEGYEVGNFGENGISITGYGGSWNNPDMAYIKQHFYTDSLAFEPDIIAIMLGTNDATGWANAESSFVDEYHALLDSYLEELPDVRFIMMVSPPTKDGNQFGIPNQTIRDEINPVQRDLAEEYGFEVLDLREEFETTEDYEAKYLRPNDGVHFTVEAAQYVAGRVWDIAKNIAF